MKKIYSLIGVLWASISIALLILEGIELGQLHGPFAVIVSFFESAMSFIFSPLEPYAVSVGTWILSWFGFEAELNYYWKYVYTIILLYSGAQATTAWQAQHKGFAIFRAIVGFVVGFAGAATIGIIPVDMNFSLFLIPMVIGLTFSVYQLFNNFWIGLVWRKKDIQLIWPGFRFSMKYPMYFLVIGVFTAVLSFVIGDILHLGFIKYPAAFALIVYALILVLFWYALGLFHAFKEDNKSSFFKNFQKQGPTALAKIMVHSLFGASLFLIANAGWALAVR